MIQQFGAILEKSLKEQGFNIVLLSAGLYFFYYKWDMAEQKMDLKIAQFQTEIRACDEERSRLSVEVAKLQAKIDNMIARPKYR
jgi:cell division protein FtsB